jgi:preprotein translocase subunit SecA
MRQWWRSLFGKAPVAATPGLERVKRLRAGYAELDDDSLARAGRRATTLPEMIAVTAVVAARVLGLQMFDSQLQGALALGHGRVIEMPTGEGKTLAAVPAIAWLARGRQGVHVLTANDYLARRDAEWMRGIYERLGLRVAAVRSSMTTDERRAAYAADVTYATANEVGFDYLRDGLACDTSEQVQRGFHTAVIDEADSILIDEARLPLVIAGGAAPPTPLPARADRVVRELRPHRHYTSDPAGRQVVLTGSGVAFVERAMGCANLFEAEGLAINTAVQDALHAHVLLKRDVDYVVSNDVVLSVDEFKGRVVRDRRWPAGLQPALEWKEGVSRTPQGRVLGSVTIEHLVALYPVVCGMTGTAASQAEEFRDVYGLDVEVIPPNRPVVRRDDPDRLFDTTVEKDVAIGLEVRRVHALGRPVLVGTASVEESERLSRTLGDLPHHTLNARNEEAEAAIIARAGERGAVTISTNMAGRGVDIRLEPSVADLGGLHVIGTTRHDSQRIDDQLRGRAGRQGDPGSSQFFVSREDPIVCKYSAGADMPLDQVQRIAAGQNLDIRRFLRRYESILEAQRLTIAARRQAVLTGQLKTRSESERLSRLAAIDDEWADYLVAAADLRSGVVWISLGYADPLRHYLREMHAMFQDLQRSLDADASSRVIDQASAVVRRRGATWTYLTTDEPFGRMTERVMRRLVQAYRARRT